MPTLTHPSRLRPFVVDPVTVTPEALDRLDEWGWDETTTAWWWTVRSGASLPVADGERVVKRLAELDAAEAGR